MRGKHTVEKIGGTSMSRFKEVMDNLIIGKLPPNEFYNRIFVVSAYGGITNMLLENKKSGAYGVYSYFVNEDQKWEKALDDAREKMLSINHSFKNIGLDVKKADEFINERMDGIKNCLQDLIKIRSYGHLWPENYLPPSREFLSAVGEAHSAFNSTLILQAHNVNAVFIDLTGWKEIKTYSIDVIISEIFSRIDLERELPIVTGYTKCSEGMMSNFDRGYSEITFSKIAVITGAREGIIHKEFHLCTGDPLLIGIDSVKVIGNMNFDVADQLSDMGMEAIHPSASKEMEFQDIPIRIKNAFEPMNPGTLISRDYMSATPRVDMICGRNDIVAIEVFDSNMVREIGYDYKLVRVLANNGISYIAKTTNANTITHYIDEKEKNIDTVMHEIKTTFPKADVSGHKLAIVSVIGTNMTLPNFIAKAASALAEANINILAVDQCLRQVNIQFIIRRDKFKEAQLALHKKLVEEI